MVTGGAGGAKFVLQTKELFGIFQVELWYCRCNEHSASISWRWVLKMLKVMSAVAVLLLASAAVRADGMGDGRVGVSGGSGASGDCNSFQLTTDGTGAITTGPNTECKVSGANASSITIAVPVGETGTGPGLQVYSPLLTNVTSQVPQWAQSWLSQFDWTESCPATPVTAGGESVFECILTAPTMPTDPVSTAILDALTQLGII